ncbi:ParB N-terminal domain-containing protein [Lacisediminihabitans sp. H27-G8]|uniref:ParB N-terminal domain-containing protein n=1 Tax=Lacisediminihabitans sp. H27-G8 TaxID=3111909 RepID=UPI0038FC0F50
MTEGHIELARAVASIRVGHRLRTDLGDLDELVQSIELQGLLQPITISPDGTLICGVRRYAAVLELGWKTVNVWVRSGISTDLEQLMAEQHENTLRKPFTPLEAARLYAELKPLYQEDAARRKAATQYRFDPENVEFAGPAKFAGPYGDARAQAARAITGRRSDLTLERVLEVQRLATDPAAAPHIRETAVRELEAMDNDHKVNRHYLVVKAALTSGASEVSSPQTQPLNELDAPTSGMPFRPAGDEDDLVQAARHALTRARATRSIARTTPDGAVRQPPTEVAHFGVRAFLMTITETDYWWLHYDAEEIGGALSVDQWERFNDWVAQSVAFHETARTAAKLAAVAPATAGEGM